MVRNINEIEFEKVLEENDSIIHKRRGSVCTNKTQDESNCLIY